MVTAADPAVVLAQSGVVACSAAQTATPTAGWGCLSLPDDILAESSPLPPLSLGNVLAFPNAGAYGIWSSPALFHGSPLPTEVAFDGSTIHVLRERKPAQSMLDSQQHLIRKCVEPRAERGEPEVSTVRDPHDSGSPLSALGS